MLLLIFYSLLPLLPLYLVAQHLNVHNPASPFFFLPNSQLYGDAFTSPHSDHRILTATEFIKSHSGSSIDLARSKEETSPVQNEEDADSNFKISVGVVSVNRPDGIQYLDACLGSILEGMTKEERNQIHLSTFIADVDPADHPFFKEQWTWNLNDEVVVRSDDNVFISEDDNLNKAMRNKIKVKQLPPDLLKRLQTNTFQRKSKTSPWHQKESLDYTTTLSSCLDSQIKYCLILEDDVVLKRGWFGILKGHIHQAERLDEERNRNSSLKHSIHSFFFRGKGQKRKASNFKPWVFIRLFYAEKYGGWEDYEVPKIVQQVVFYWLAFLLSLTILRSYLFGRSSNLSRNQGSKESKIFGMSTSSSSSLAILRLSTLQLFFFSFIILPYLGLFILSGRNTHPSHSIPYGLSTMNERGCCTQSLLFKTDYVPGIIDYLEREENYTRRPKDLLTIEYALGGNGGRFENGKESDQGKENRFRGGKILAIRPMLTQHIGHSSSRNKGFKRKSRVWGFGFEREWAREDW